ncbi:Ogr/Delta-like zinc finger protein [Desulfovibrio falkowii]|uniref:ogr/Delta-like zinc finger family protein n=1 Tax=Desulfovibrio sp. WGS1351 TaxID=3366814 RepID=UPI00372D712D
MRIYCPRCEAKAIIRTSKELSATMRQLYCLCGDPQCGHTFVMDLTFSHTLSPSALDLPDQIRRDIRKKSAIEQVQLFAQLA